MRTRNLRIAAMLLVLCIAVSGCAAGVKTAKQLFKNVDAAAAAAGYTRQPESELVSRLYRDGADCGVSITAETDSAGALTSVAVQTLDFYGSKDDFMTACALAVQAYVPKYRKDIDGARAVLDSTVESADITERGSSLYTEDGVDFEYDFIAASSILPFDAGRFSIRAD